MNNKNNIENLFEELKGKFDINELNSGHEARFLKKLNNEESVNVNKKSIAFWKPLLAIAASIVICISVFGLYANQNEILDLASVSPELSETQDFFTVTIENELKQLNKERSPFTENIINDALEQVQLLENDYQNLKTDLTESGSDQRVIYAMITNFQSRIDILNTVLEQIETIKKLKINTDELENTI